MNKIKIAQIGMGHDHATLIFKSLSKQNDIFDLVGYAVPQEEKDRFAKAYECADGYRQMTVEEIMNDKSIVAVTVETEEVILTKYAQMAANNHKHIHMDKPGGTVLFDFEQLINTVKANQLVFHIGYMYRYNTYVMELLDKVNKGELGEIYSVEAHMSCTHSIDKRNWLGNFKGGMLFFLGCHLIDIIYRIQGEPDEVVPLSCSTGIDNVTAEDFGMVVFKYKNGVSFAKACAKEKGGFSRRQLVVCGSKKTIELKPLEWYTDVKKGLLYTLRSEKFTDNWCDMGVDTESQPEDRYDKMMMSFAEMCRGEKKNSFSYDYELSLYKLILKSCGVQF